MLVLYQIDSMWKWDFDVDCLVYSRWSLNNMDSNDASKMFQMMPSNRTHTLIRDDADAAAVQGYLMK